MMLSVIISILRRHLTQMIGIMSISRPRQHGVKTQTMNQYVSIVSRQFLANSTLYKVLFIRLSSHVNQLLFSLCPFVLFYLRSFVDSFFGVRLKLNDYSSLAYILYLNGVANSLLLQHSKSAFDIGKKNGLRPNCQ